MRNQGLNKSNLLEKMSRQRLSDLLLKKKQTNPKLAVKPAPKPQVKKEVDFDLETQESTQEESVPRLVKAENDSVQDLSEVAETPVRQQKQTDRDSRGALLQGDRAAHSERHDQDLESVEEELSAVKKRPAETNTRGRKPGIPNSTSEEPLGKNMIVRLLKTTEVQSISSDVIDAVKEVMTTIVKDLCTFASSGIISDEKLNSYILKFVNDLDKDIPSDTVIPPANFERFAKPIFEENNCGLKRNTFFFFQQFVELLVVKLMSKADMVAGVAKRSRVTSVDLLVAMHIYLE